MGNSGYISPAALVALKRKWGRGNTLVHVFERDWRPRLGKSCFRLSSCSLDQTHRYKAAEGAMPHSFSNCGRFE